MSRRAIAAVAILRLVVGTGRVLADPVEEEARRLFDEATVALQTGRVAEARDLLRRSLTLYSNPATAFNLAVALRGTGQTLESLELFDEILSGRHGRLAQEQTAEATRLRNETALEIAHVDVRTTGAERTTIRVDGQAAASVADGGNAEISVDAGEHELVASAPGRIPARRTVRLDRSGRARWDIRLVLSGPIGSRPGEPQGALSSPWLWVGVGGLVAGAVLVTALVLASGGEADPVSDPIFGVVEALTSRR